MKFGMFVMNQHSLGDDPAERWEEHLEQVRLIRDLGFHSVWCGQHYLTEGVWMMQTWPSVAQVAAHAGDMTVGTGILLLA
ncbi:MAG: LLM class flavin-dependent oxidoreductase, partial [Nitrospinae bacterium]|nr:LLM class flavin-dependent oxidoreductase [Nitrospinota bacterium]